MYTPSKIFVLFALALAAAGSPHVPRTHHHGLAARVASSQSGPVVPASLVDDVPKQKARRLRKRSSTARCQLNPSNSSSAAASSSAAPANVESPPPASPLAPITTADAPSSTPAPAPAPAPAPPAEPSSSTPATPVTPTSSAPPAASGSTPSYLIGTQSGQGTWYGIGLGACGITNSGNDRIAAVSHLLFDTFPGYTGTNPNNNPVCNRGVTAFFQGKSTHVTITDRCTGCALTDLDFSPAAFDDLADPSLGRIDITWVWD